LKDHPETPPAPSLEMDFQEMRRLGHEIVDRIVDRWAHLPEGPAWGFGTRAELELLLGGPPPEEPRDPDGVLRTVFENVLPRAGRIDHPRFFAFIPSSPTWPSVLADMLATGFNVFQGTWLESAGPSQLELVVMDWIRDWIGFPEGAGGLLTSGGSAANLCALTAAREWRDNPPDPVVYLSDQGHSSVERGAKIAGIRRQNVRKVPTNSRFQIDLEALASALHRDRESGLTPLCICANAGATNTGAIDPLEDMARMARAEDVWLHVDGAYGGFAVLTPGGREALRGIESADSVTLDPHKWLFQPYETGCLLVRDTSALEKAFRILPEYLQDTALGREQVNFADRGIQLTRGFRALKIWMSIQILGLRAFREGIGSGIEHALAARDYIQASPVLEMMAPVSLGIVCFRFLPEDVRIAEAELERLNERIQNELVRSGLAMMSSTRLRGRFSLRLAILNYRSRWSDVKDTLEAVESLGRRFCQAAETIS